MVYILGKAGIGNNRGRTEDTMTSLTCLPLSLHLPLFISISPINGGAGPPPPAYCIPQLPASPAQKPTISALRPNLNASASS